MDLPAGPWPCILADPPWSYRCFSPKGERKAAVRHYQTMRLGDIVEMPVAEIAAKNAWLFLWTTGPNLQQAFRVLESWGFRYSSIAFTWVKTNPKAPVLFLDHRSFHLGLGHTTRKNAEFCLLGRRGSPKRLSKSVRELIIAARREHSRKPEECYARIEQFCAGPRLELFGRQTRPGWTTWGNEAQKFDEPPPASVQVHDPPPPPRCAATIEMFNSEGGSDDEDGEKTVGRAGCAVANGGDRAPGAAGV